MRCMERPFWAANDIKYRNSILLVTGEYILLKSMPGLRLNHCAISLVLYVITSLFSFLLRMKTHFDPTGKMLRGVGITDENTSHFFWASAIQPRLFSYIWSSWSAWCTLPWTYFLDQVEQKLMSTIVVFLLSDSQNQYNWWKFYLPFVTLLYFPKYSSQGFPMS
jgi:hypothetical protein